MEIGRSLHLLLAYCFLERWSLVSGLVRSRRLMVRAFTLLCRIIILQIAKIFYVMKMEIMIMNYLMFLILNLLIFSRRYRLAVKKRSRFVLILILGRKSIRVINPVLMSTLLLLRKELTFRISNRYYRPLLLVNIRPTHLFRLLLCRMIIIGPLLWIIVRRVVLLVILIIVVIWYKRLPYVGLAHALVRINGHLFIRKTLTLRLILFLRLNPLRLVVM